MPIEGSKQLAEIEGIELDDSHHDFGGPRARKGNDFASFWLIVRITELERASAADYMFICEYLQDVAEFDSSQSPLKVSLYQLKMKADGYWGPTLLTGQNKTDTTKTPKPTKPLPKLHRSVRAFKHLDARGAFISNAPYEVPLRDGSRSTNSHSILLDTWDDAHSLPLRQGLAAIDRSNVDDIDLSRLELRKVHLDPNDLERHTIGIVFDFLSQVAPDQSAQASSLVDSLYVRIARNSRRDEKCASWKELVERRGFGRAAFAAAVEGLKAIPDRVKHRDMVFKKVSEHWNSRKHARVEAALLRCAREKVLVGTGNRWQIDAASLHSICTLAEERGLSDLECFEEVKLALASQVPTFDDDELSALAIYEMTQWNLNQTLD